ncbi:hypothetical protein [Sphingomonas sp. G-3-2-10]|uniref:hypothetical protein n=1 Tax=Sphingomonas sp. G-3-2-10 TaxID=2728838 RepID=UPI00146DB6A3|nr:hypothetical protein [Sphingomonas sp. G-3-2-10]NML04274.1 hypothetical protein [Sphingomonas sp. G-3-2-10]
MADIDDANTFNAARGYTDWAALSSPVREAALVRASDYIGMRYALRDPSTGAEDTLLGTARYIIARDLATNEQPFPIRAETPVAKEAKELAGMKKSTEYGDAPADPYPLVTSLLAPLMLTTTNAVTFGRLVR